MIVEISVIPLGVMSLSKYIAQIIKILDEENIKFEINPMGTIFVLSKFAELGKILERIDDVLIKMGSIRNYYVIKIDTKNDMDRRVKSVLKKL